MHLPYCAQMPGRAILMLLAMVALGTSPTAMQHATLAMQHATPGGYTHLVTHASNLSVQTSVQCRQCG